MYVVIDNPVKMKVAVDFLERREVLEILGKESEIVPARRKGGYFSCVTWFGGHKGQRCNGLSVMGDSYESAEHGWTEFCEFLKEKLCQD